jgi:glycine/D-amino acid oxidase-like deaminating enzyme
VADLDLDLYYSMIEGYEGQVPVIKVGAHFMRTPISNLDEVWGQPLSPGEIKWAKERTSAYLNSLGIPVDADGLEYAKGYSCVYSLTASEVPYVTPIPETPGLVVVAGLSGVGAKGALAYGKLAADLVRNQKEDDPMYQKATSLMGLERLQKDLKALEREQAKKVAYLGKADGSLLFSGQDTP